MVAGVGGSSFAAELERMQPMTGGVQPIPVDEYRARNARVQGLDALHLDTSTARQRAIWQLAQRAQRAGFEAAVLGAPCEAVDDAARGAIVAAGFGPGYKVPGLPHRTGHGIGMDVHGESIMVKGNRTSIAAGLCFSVEPTISVYGESGVRLEDIITMAGTGARWFTEPCPSVDDPFGVTP